MKGKACRGARECTQVLCHLKLLQKIESCRAEEEEAVRGSRVALIQVKKPLNIPF